MKINVDFILSLQKDPNSNLISPNKITIENPYVEELKKLRENFPKFKMNGPEIYNAVQNSTLKNVFKSWDYARYPDQANGHLEYDPERIKSNLTGAYRYNDDILKSIEEYVVACNLNTKLNKVRLEPQVLAYSHLYLGWRAQPKVLNEHFSVIHRTNFGYGYASHFYTILTYRNIPLVPYSDWVAYRFVERAQLINYSAKHPICSDGWEPAMKFTADAWNLMVRNERQFVEKHIISECEVMVKGLERFLIGNDFNLITANNGFRDLPYVRSERVTFGGYNADLFKSEKIAGALTFIDSIKELEPIMQVSGYINRILSCNRRIQSSIPSTVRNLEYSIVQIQNEVTRLESIYESKKIVNQKRTDLFNTFYRSLTVEEKNDSDTYEKRFNMLNPTLVNAYEEFRTAGVKLTSKQDELRHSEDILRKMIVLQKEINDYFETNALAVG
ncbi:hypothetical protein [Pedobacter nyackensis]|uniref:hypothetical protein n=1 Tax=Pedobacter nyackensis TaxID=475255 RepID=UPI00292DFE48|nr:hypothetical protein [Pedobacter nyackensis]